MDTIEPATAQTTAHTILPTRRGLRLWRRPSAARPEPVAELALAAPHEQDEQLAAHATWTMGRAAYAHSTPGDTAPSDLRPSDTTAALAALRTLASPQPPASDSERVASLTAEVRGLASELEEVRQRSAAERMNLLEQLAATRDARLAAEAELEGVRAVLTALEHRVPAPRQAAPQQSVLRQVS